MGRRVRPGAHGVEGDVPVDGGRPPVEVGELAGREHLGGAQREALEAAHQEGVEQGHPLGGKARAQRSEVLDHLQVVPVVADPREVGVHDRVGGVALAVALDHGRHDGQGAARRAVRGR